jgi:hypothetical protein
MPPPESGLPPYDERAAPEGTTTGRALTANLGASIHRRVCYASCTLRGLYPAWGQQGGRHDRPVGPAAGELGARRGGLEAGAGSHRGAQPACAEGGTGTARVLRAPARGGTSCRRCPRSRTAARAAANALITAKRRRGGHAEEPGRAEAAREARAHPRAARERRPHHQANDAGRAGQVPGPPTPAEAQAPLIGPAALLDLRDRGTRRKASGPPGFGL